VTFRTFFTNTAHGEDGLTLIEVVITSFLVGLIVVGTLTGFQVLNRSTADERFHDEAALVAAQSQEQLRSDPASTLDSLVGNAEHKRTYITKLDGNAYTVTQAANYVNESKPGGGCLATAASESSSKYNGDYLKVTSTVSWPQIAKSGREPVSESSIITPPDGSALEKFKDLVKAQGGDVRHMVEQVLTRANLTDKERLVARHLLDGLSSGEIAAPDRISPAKRPGSRVAATAAAAEPSEWPASQTGRPGSAASASAASRRPFSTRSSMDPMTARSPSVSPWPISSSAQSSMPAPFSAWPSR